MGLHPYLGAPPLHIDTLTSLLAPWSSRTFPVRDYIGLPRPLSFSSLPTKETFNPGRVFPLPGADSETRLFDGSKSRGRVGAAFVHLHASGSIIGSHLLPLPEYMSVFGAELCAANCALQYAANLSANLSSGPKVVSLSIDSQAALTTISQPGVNLGYGQPEVT